MFLLVNLHRQVGQVLLHLSGHLSVFVQLLGVEKRAATYSLFMGAALHIQHVGVGAALTQRPNEGLERGRKRREGRKGRRIMRTYRRTGDERKNIKEKKEMGGSREC